MATGDFTEITLGTGLAGTDLGAGVIEITSNPADDPAVWLPLTTVTGGNPELVWDADDNLIPTLTPI